MHTSEQVLCCLRGSGIQIWLSREYRSSTSLNITGIFLCTIVDIEFQKGAPPPTFLAENQHFRDINNYYLIVPFKKFVKYCIRSSFALPTPYFLPPYIGNLP